MRRILQLVTLLQLRPSLENMNAVLIYGANATATARAPLAVSHQALAIQPCLTHIVLTLVLRVGLVHSPPSLWDSLSLSRPSFFSFFSLGCSPEPREWSWKTPLPFPLYSRRWAGQERKFFLKQGDLDSQEALCDLEIFCFASSTQPPRTPQAPDRSQW